MRRLLHDHEVNDFNSDCIRIEALDEPDHEKGGGAHHKYGIWVSQPGADIEQGSDPDVVISFQHGPVKEFGANGITQEALLAIVLDRLRSFQRSRFSCRENAVAITKIEEGMMWLHKRTLDRVRKGVEGTHGVREGVEGS
jgi:hypothetical protein